MKIPVLSIRELLIGTAVACFLAGCETTGSVDADESMGPFGGAGSVAYAARLWSGLVERGLAGPGSVASKPYLGSHPHGAVLMTSEGELTVGKHSGFAIVKKNYGGEGISESVVANQPEQNLMAITVMFKREAGYDPDNRDWFWVKYKPDGSLDVNPNGVPLAGRVAKGKPEGCIACHALAPGNDHVFNHDRFAQ